MKQGATLIHSDIHPAERGWDFGPPPVEIDDVGPLVIATLVFAIFFLAGVACGAGVAWAVFH
jgi:hypothetical protein